MCYLWNQPTFFHIPFRCNHQPTQYTPTCEEPNPMFFIKLFRILILNVCWCKSRLRSWTWNYGNWWIKLNIKIRVSSMVTKLRLTNIWYCVNHIYFFIIRNNKIFRVTSIHWSKSCKRNSFIQILNKFSLQVLCGINNRSFFRSRPQIFWITWCTLCLPQYHISIKHSISKSNSEVIVVWNSGSKLDCVSCRV